MLCEQYIASVGTPTKPPDTSVVKDAAIFVHEFQPLAAQRALFKKSATPKNCLAVSDNHVFAAQAGRAVVHVYNREKGNQEATVPFTERISAISLACNHSVLILGTLEGRLFLWETSSGRFITTSQTHLQAITKIAVDPSSNFFLSASKDSTVQVWSISDLLSMDSSHSRSFTPLRTFDSHRTEVTVVELGHSKPMTNFAISAAKDRTCLVWNFNNNTVLRTYLLSGIPSSLALDPADRAAYVGYEDGDLQMLDLCRSSTGNLDSVRNGHDSTVPIQQPETSRWKILDHSHGAALSVDVSYDGTIVLSGHESGSVLNWDVARQAFVSVQTTNPFPGPVNNLFFLPVTGFVQRPSNKPSVRVPTPVKPKFGAFDVSDDGDVPGNYVLNTILVGKLSSRSDFDLMCHSHEFPEDLLEEGYYQLEHQVRAPDEEPSGDFMALDDNPQKSAQETLEEANVNLKMQLEALRRVQTATFQKMDKLVAERNVLLKREQKPISNGKVNGSMDDPDSDISSDVDIHLENAAREARTVGSIPVSWENIC